MLKHDSRRIPLLLDYVRYPYNPAIQAEAVRIASHLAGEWQLPVRPATALGPASLAGVARLHEATVYEA